MPRSTARAGLLLLLLLSLSVSALSQETPTPLAESYTVRQGDTLAAIARAFGTTVEVIAQANDLSARDTLRIGQVLTIPVQPDDPALTMATQPYTVARGDTLFLLAQRFNTTVDLLIRLNRLTERDTISIGQVLRVPASAPLPIPTATQAPAATPSATALPPTPIARMERGVEVFLRNQSATQVIAAVAPLDVTWVKIVVNWREVEPIEGEPVFTPLDIAVAGLRAQGRRILLTLTGAPDWARPSATAFVRSLAQLGPPDDPALFGQFAARVAARYAGSVQAYEIWLEPNLRRSWLDAATSSRETARLSSVSYIDLLRAASQAIRSADPAALVLSAGLAPTGLTSPQNAIADRAFLRAALDEGLLDLVDAVAVQADGFANPPSARCCTSAPDVVTHFEHPEFYFLDTIETYRALVDAAGGHAVPLWVTRFGWGSADINTLAAPNMLENPFLTYTDAAEQAAYAAEAFALGAALGYVGPMILHNLNGCEAALPEACFYSASASPALLDVLR